MYAETALNTLTRKKKVNNRHASQYSRNLKITLVGINRVTFCFVTHSGIHDVCQLSCWKPARFSYRTEETSEHEGDQF